VHHSLVLAAFARLNEVHETFIQMMKIEYQTYKVAWLPVEGLLRSREPTSMKYKGNRKSRSLTVWPLLREKKAGKSRVSPYATTGTPKVS